MRVAILSRGDSDVCARLCSELSRLPDVQLLVVLTTGIPKPSLRRRAVAAKIRAIAAWRNRVWGERHPTVRALRGSSHVIVQDEGHALGPLQSFGPDVLIISGTKKVGDEVLGTAKVALNIHHGFVPLYRGVSSADWVTLERNFNYYVATVHMAVSALDAGEVVAARYVTPYYREPWWLYRRRLMIEGADAAVDVAKAWPNVARVKQPPGLPARNLRHRDKTADHEARVRHVAASDDFARYAALQGANTSRPHRLRMRYVKLARPTLAPGLYVLNYHDICSDDDVAAYRAHGVRSIYTTINRFREHLAYFNANFRCAPLPQALAIWRDGGAVNERVLSITFDDGLRSLHPYLDEMVRANLAPALFLCGDPLVKGIPIHNHGKLLEARPKEQPYIGAVSATEWLKWGRISAIGSHTWSHNSLADISPEAQREEIVGAHTAICQKLGMGLSYFAYPFGHLKARSVVSEYFAHEAGAEVFDCNGGINQSPTSVGAVLRIGVHNETVPDLDHLLRKQWVR